VLRGFGGTKTFREFMAMFAGDRKTMNERTFTKGVKYRFVATATPSPNEYIELLAYAGFLDIMEISQAKTRFFKRDSEKADNLTLHRTKKRNSGCGYRPGRCSCKSRQISALTTPATTCRMKVHLSRGCGRPYDLQPDKHGRGRCFARRRQVCRGRKEKRDTLDDRIAKMVEILSGENPDDHFLIWHDLEAERHAIEKAVPESVASTVHKTWTNASRRSSISRTVNFNISRPKPVIAGSGCNFQRHCHKAIFLGIGYKFNDFIQAIHRIHRFLQESPSRFTSSMPRARSSSCKRSRTMGTRQGTAAV
jgi:hypothetical protein